MWTANHSYDHPFLDQLSSTDLFNNLLGTQHIHEQVTGRSQTLFRPPFGRTNDTIRQTATTLGMTEVLWTVDSRDYAGATSAQITQSALRVQPGGIILMHDAGYQATIDAIPGIVNSLKRRGLCAGKIVSSSEPVTPWPGATHFARAGRP